MITSKPLKTQRKKFTYQKRGHQKGQNILYFQLLKVFDFFKRFGIRVKSWAGIFKPLWSPGIDAKASTPPAYVAWRAGTITLFLVGA